MRAGDPAAEPARAAAQVVTVQNCTEGEWGTAHPRSDVDARGSAGCERGHRSAGACIVPPDGRKAKLQFAVIASFGSGSIRHGRARSVRPLEAVEPDDEEVPARMKTVVQYLVAGTATLALAGTGFADDVFVYPQKGQSPEQQNKDSYECYNWAKAQSRVDPPPPPPPAQPGQRARGAVGGAARGAALGAAGGAIAGAARTGRAAGGAVGGVHGGHRPGARHEAHRTGGRVRAGPLS